MPQAASLASPPDGNAAPKSGEFSGNYESTLPKRLLNFAIDHHGTAPAGIFRFAAFDKAAHSRTTTIVVSFIGL